MGESTSNPHALTQPLVDAVALFEELGIGYALVGGVAASCYGRARFTEDLDFVAVSGQGAILADNPQVMSSHRFDLSCAWKLDHQNGTEVDLWKDEFSDEIVARAVEIELAGRKVRVAEAHDLIAMKLRAGRVQDDYDISEIVKGTAVQDESVRERVTEQPFRHYLGVKQRVRG